MGRVSEDSCTGDLQCPATTTGYLDWPATPALTEAIVACPAGMKGPAQRRCKEDGTWEDVSVSCGRSGEGE